MRVAVIGSGMSGICMAAKLRGAGIDDFTLFEKGDGVGGTWRENRYPGLSCDVPSRYYSYSFAPNPDWTRRFAPGPEIRAYLERVSETLDLGPRTRLHTEVTEARWDATCWQLRTAGGGEAEPFDVLVCATGILHRPRLPEIDGLDAFAGKLFHSARWDQTVELERARIGLIGTGSTGVQIATALGGRVGSLAVFQRTPQWILPVANGRYSPLTRTALRRLRPLNRLAYRVHQQLLERIVGPAVLRSGPERALLGALCRANLRLGVRNPELRRRLTPSYEPLCKRLVMSAGYYRALQRPGVELVSEAIERVEERGIRTEDGRLRELDVIVLATGFDPSAFMRPMNVIGEGGVTLEQAWEQGPRAYRTVALPSFPNMFMILGPHSPFGNQSLIPVAETQADFALQWIELLRSGAIASASPMPEASERFNLELRAALPDTVWATGCSSWYLGPDGLPELWPWTPAAHRRMLAKPRREEFVER